MYWYKRVQGIPYINFFPSSNFSRSEVDVEVNIVFVSDHVVPYSWYELHIITGSQEKKSSNFCDYVTKWDIDNS